MILWVGGISEETWVFLSGRAVRHSPVNMVGRQPLSMNCGGRVADAEVVSTFGQWEHVFLAARPAAPAGASPRGLIHSRAATGQTARGEEEPHVEAPWVCLT